MKPHPRMRYTVKWGGLWLSLVLVAAWVSSVWFWLRWQGSGHLWTIQASSGAVRMLVRDLGYDGVAKPARWQGGTGDASLDWWFAYFSRGGTPTPIRYVQIPLWSPALAVLVVTVGAWRRDAVARRGGRSGSACLNCGYDLRGLAAGTPCPECGSAPT